MEKSNAELFETLQSMNVPGEDEHVDLLMGLCRDGMGKKPDDPIVRVLLSTTIQAVVNVRDRGQLNQQVAALDPEDRASFEVLKALSDDELRVWAESETEMREKLAKLLLFNSEQRRSEKEIKGVSDRLRKMT